MSFISITFILFFIVVFPIYWKVKRENRWIVLLVSGYIFYGSWNIRHLFLILLITAFTYSIGLLLERTTKARKILLVSAVVGCIGLLFYFKYFNFFLSGINAILRIIPSDHHQFTALNILLPVGISFYTFQALGYVVDVYRGRIKTEKDIGKYAAFISFFPQLVAGPIERTENLLPQIKNPQNFSYSMAVSGLEKMMWGAWKKVVIADCLAIYADTVFGNPAVFTGFASLFAVLAFTLEIYCDFSGYSDIAIGAGRLLGIELMENFKAPYFSSSLKEFWRRWHISLSIWFRDYLYIPLGGNRKSKIRTKVNLLITFLISGLWHGASLNFLVWGGCHGIGQLIESSIFSDREKKSKITRFLRIFITFVFCTFAWIFFRAESLQDAVIMLRMIPQGISSPIGYFTEGLDALKISTGQLLTIIGSIAVLFYVDIYKYSDKRIPILNVRPLKWLIYWGLSAWVIFTWINNGSNSFVYFQF